MATNTNAVYLWLCFSIAAVNPNFVQDQFRPIVGSYATHYDHEHVPLAPAAGAAAAPEGHGHISCAVIVSEEDPEGAPSYHSPPPPCISTEFINHAFTEARLHYGLVDPHPTRAKNLEKHADEVERLAFALLDTSRAVAHHYGLDAHQIFDLLPKLDVSTTDISRFCPVPVQVQLHPPHRQFCKHSQYRTLSGHCNNVYRPHWGAAFTPFQNFLSPDHPDGLSEPRGHVGHSSSLPSARLVSQHIHHDTRILHDHAITTMLIAWGQIIDHDITLTADTHDPRTFNTPECCHSLENVHHNCLPIEIPPTDPFYAHYPQPCMTFARSLAGLRPDCRLGPRKAYNRISSFLDASFVYGSSRKASAELRMGKHGLLKAHHPFREHGLKELLPLKLHEPDRECIRENDSQFCFLAGDIRVNEQLILTVLHTIFMREHNRIAKRLSAINPGWGDERLFQETRRILVATVQHITFNEFLPMVLGRVAMEKSGLMLATKGEYWSGYNPHIDPTAAEEFVTSAFRFGHSLLPHKIERWSPGHHFIDSVDLHRLLRQPFDLFKPGRFDSYVLGLVNQLTQAMDEGVTVEVTNLLFKEPGQQLGMDLPAINIQRGREHGVPAYAYVRQFCGLPPIPDQWEGLIGVFHNETIYRYKDIYASPHDIDLWSGGVSEIAQHDSLLGPTFSCLIAKQFGALRAGDRFWYENPDMPSSFRLDQLDEIRTVTLSRLLCDNTDDLKTVQLYAMVYPDLVTNPRVSCSGRIIPGMNLEKWREDVPQVANHYGPPGNNSAYLHAQTHAIHSRFPHRPHPHPHAHGPQFEVFEGLPGSVASGAPLIPIADNYNSEHHNHHHLDSYHHALELEFHSVSGAHVHEPPPYSHPHHYPVEGAGVGNYVKTQPHNYNYFGVNHGLYDNSPHEHPLHTVGGGGGVHGGVGAGGHGGVGNYGYPKDKYEFNDEHADNYENLIESQPPPTLNYDNYKQKQLSYFPISGILKPPQQPHHNEHAHAPKTPNLGSAERPIEVHELRDLLLHQTPENVPEKLTKSVPPTKSSVQRRNYHSKKSSRRPFPFPLSPFPGLSGVFSPNPGYLVKQRFYSPPHLKNLNWRPLSRRG